MKPFIRWAGSKRLILDTLKPYWELKGHGSRYVEPFAGSACFFFDIEPRAALLGDLNEELITTYREVRRDPELVIAALKRLPRGEKGYYATRSINPKELSKVDVAARFLYLNRYCFNGLYRTNQKGIFNVPYGPPKTPLLDFDDRIREASKILKKATLIGGDFESTLEQVEPGDFVYLDPPYAIEDRRMFAEYLPGSFSLDDLDRLSEWLTRMHELGATFLVSYADSKEARKLLKPWQSRRVWTRRNIAGFASARRGSYELLATNLKSSVL